MSEQPRFYVTVTSGYLTLIGKVAVREVCVHDRLCCHETIYSNAHRFTSPSYATRMFDTDYRAALALAARLNGGQP